MRRVFIYTMLGVAVVLVACAQADEGRRTNNEGRRTNDGGRTPIVIATVPTAPTWTATPQPTATLALTPTPTHTPTPLPTPTRTPTPLPIPIPTPSAAEIRAARLPALANLTWRAEGNQVVLGDGVATLDEKTGGLRWNDFPTINHFLREGATLQDRQALLAFLNELRACLENQGDVL